MPSPSIRNWQTSPPAGGWSLTYTPPERPNVALPAFGHSHTDVLTHIKAWRLNNSLPADDAGVFSYCNGVWCQRDPARCLSAPAMPEPVAGIGRRTLTPHDYGPYCWGFLNTFGVNFNHGGWMSTISQIRMLIDPANPNSNGSGCAACRSHFDEFLAAHPPDKVTTAEAASVWSWLAHDAANVYSGKAHRPTFRQCAALFGWVVLSAEQFAEVKSGLAR